MTPTPEAFTDLLARARQGDNDAMMALIRQYEPEIRRVAHQRLGPALRDCLASVDVVQSVHRSLIRNLRENKLVINRQEDLTALAVTFVVRKVSRQWQKVQREEQVLRLVQVLLARAAKEEDPAVLAERRDRVQHLLEQVDDRDRQLLELHLRDCNTKEIANLLNVKENVVRVQRSRLFRKLRECGVNPLET